MTLLHGREPDTAGRDPGGAFFRAMVEGSPDVALVLRADGGIVYASPSLAAVVGGTEAPERGYRLRDLVHPEDVTTAEHLVVEGAGDPAERARGVLRMQAWNGRWFHFEVFASRLRVEGAADAVLLNGRDVTARVELEQRLSYEALHDPLTSLANRVRFRERVSDALARESDAGSVAVVLLDLDLFKTINDTLGHAEGDTLLKEVGARLLSATRGSDTVARLGGDEFAVLLTGLRGPHEVNPVLERIRGGLRRPVTLASREVTTSASVGVALSTPTATAEEILHHADVAMYAAKAGGRGTHRFFEPQMQADALDRARLEDDLRKAVQDEALDLVYQPLVDLATGRVYGVEALIRWTHPERGPIPPAVLIPIAEETGLIVPLGRWVLHTACAKVAEWQEIPGQPPLSVSVNVSGRQLAEEGIVAEVEGALRSSKLKPGTLVLEITESTLVQNTETLLARLDALKALGVRLAIDDFGTGYSSLAYLRAFPVDILKVDRRFVADLGGDESASALARAVLSLGATLGLPTVAEGIETQVQLDELRLLGCEFGQGFLFAHPLTPERAAQHLRD